MENGWDNTTGKNALNVIVVSQLRIVDYIRLVKKWIVEESNNNSITEALNNHSDSMFTGLDRGFLPYVWKCLNYSVFLMVSGRLFHNEGTMYDKVFCPELVLWKGCLSFAKLFLVSILQFGANSKIESYCIYALVNSFFSRQPIYQSKLRERYMLHYLI